MGNLFVFRTSIATVALDFKNSKLYMPSSIIPQDPVTQIQDI
jgi:hypothetical protein